MVASEFAAGVAGIGLGVVILGSILWLLERYFDG